MTAPTTEAPAPAKKRGRETVLDMVRSLGLILAIIFVLLIVTPARGLVFNHGKANSNLQTYRDSDQLLEWKDLVGTAPVLPAVPASWRLNNARIKGEKKSKADLHVGWVTANSQYVGLDQGYLPLAMLIVDDAGNGLVSTGTTVIDGRTWTTLGGPKASGEIGLTYTANGLTTLLVSSLTAAQLAPIAGTLHATKTGGLQ